jgi:DNA repair exonuclease SbcCD ATPase subunit
LNEETRLSIVEAWESRLAEAREELAAELREEFAQRYEHDKGLIVEAVDTFIKERVEAEIAELAEDRQAVAAERVAYKKAVSEHAKKLDKFVAEQLAKEVRELRNERAGVQEHVSKLDDFVVEQLATELKEFHEDKRDLVEQKVKMVAEGKKQLAEAKKDFIKRAANKVETVVNNVLRENVQQLKEDITAARENDFGRRIFETFANEYRSSYLNESSTVKELQKSLSEVKSQLAEAVEAVNAQAETTKITESKLRVAEDKYARKETLDALLKPLAKGKKEIMVDLLESVKTENLEKQFNKYLPSVLDGETPKADRKPLNESVTSEHTGNKTVQPSKEDVEQNVVEIDQIRKLAGLSK